MIHECLKTGGVADAGHDNHTIGREQSRLKGSHRQKLALYTNNIFSDILTFSGFVLCCKGLHPSTTPRTTSFFPQEVRFTVEMPPAPQPRSSQDQEVKSYFQILILVQTECAYFSSTLQSGFQDYNLNCLLFSFQNCNNVISFEDPPPRPPYVIL